MTTTSTTFSIKGKRHRKTGDVEGNVTWTDGTLSGTAEDVADVERLASAYEGQSLKPIVGPASTTNHLGNPYVACMLMKRIYIAGTTTQAGSLPKINLPPGAIA